MRLCETESLLY